MLMERMMIGILRFLCFCWKRMSDNHSEKIVKNSKIHVGTLKTSFLIAWLLLML